MSAFQITDQDIDISAMRQSTMTDHSGGFCSFEGWVRDHHDGKAVQSLEYSSYNVLTIKEGNKIIEEAKEKFAIEIALCTHRVGHLHIGDIAVNVAVSAAHRDAAFAACRYIIDEIKFRVPIWKKEFYTDGANAYPSCKGCKH
ncbi:molybdenum cofactor biosynthesis protein MoaE [Akkermansiaceae bacterium]|nr:molybdenum cofactor biosynthesis protein MoaE [Akkermansiaceae bacterium]